MEIRELLLLHQDREYQRFSARLVPELPPERVIGVRTPVLRKLAKEICGSPQAEAFLQELPHTYLEENHLHAFLLEEIRDFGTCVEALDRFLPYINNWATCDQMSPKILKKYPEQLLPVIERWISGEGTYRIRFGILLLMRYYLDDLFIPAYAERVASVISEEYYVKMMKAWYFATALAKQYDAVIPYLQNNCLDRWTHNKTIQKAVESFRITEAQKKYLRTLRR